MTEKHNDATLNRPEGARPIDATMVTIDIPAYVKQIKEEDAWHKNDRNAITVFKTDGLRIVLVALHKEADMLPHVSEGTMSIQMLEGEMNFSTVERNTELAKGHMLTLHKAQSYAVHADSDCVFLLTINPNT